MKKYYLQCFFALFAFATISGCNSDSASPVASNNLTGTAATGAPIAGLVTVKDANGDETPASITGTDGSFTLDVTGMTPPFLLKIMPSDGSATLYSFATTNGHTVNLTSTTNLAMFLASGNADLDAIYAAWDGTAITATEVATAEAIVRANLEDQINAAGLDANSFDLFASPFSADSTGIDAVMDDLIITIGINDFTFTDGDAVDLGFDENITPLGPPATPPPAGAITIATVSGATHTLNGTYQSACYADQSGGSQFDSLTVNGSEWINSSHEFSNETCSGSSSVVSSITANLTSGGTQTVDDWVNGEDINVNDTVQAADNTTNLVGTTATTLNIVVTAVTGGFVGDIPVGFSGALFYVVDDTGSNLILYRDDDGIVVSTADPYIDENITPLGPPATPPPAGAITIATVSGATHTLNGTYQSACYADQSGGSQFDSLTVNGSEWINSSHEFSNEACSGSSSVVSSITANLTSGGTQTVDDWVNGEDINVNDTVQAADNTTNLLGTTATTLNIVVTAVTGGFVGDIPVGFSGALFYVVDDTGSNLILYRDDDGIVVSTADPYIR